MIDQGPSEARLGTPTRRGVARAATGFPAPAGGGPVPRTRARLDEGIVAARDEDRCGPERKGVGDITSSHAVPEAARARARLVCKAKGRLAGLDVFARGVELCDPSARIELAARHGYANSPGQVLARLAGRPRALFPA